MFRPRLGPRAVAGVAIAIFLIALGLRVANVATALDSPLYGHGLRTNDSIYYDQEARRIAAGDWLGDEVFYLSPLYPYALGVAYRILGSPAADGDWSSPLAGVLFVQAVIGAINALLIFVLGVRLGGALAGSVAGLSAAAYGYFIFCDLTLMPSSLVLFVHLCAIALLDLAARSGRPWLWVLAGTALAACVLSHGSGVFVVAAALLWVVARPTEPARARLVAGLLVVAGLLPPIGMVTARNWIVGRDLVTVTSNAGTNLYIGNNPEADGAFRPHAYALWGSSLEYYLRDIRRTERDPTPSAVSRFMAGRALEFVTRHPGRAARLALRKIELFFNRYEIGTNDNYAFARAHLVVLGWPLAGFGLIAPLGLTGLGLSLVRRWRTGLLGLVFASQLACCTIFFVLGRYRLVSVACLMVFAGLAVAWAVEQLRVGMPRRVLPWFAVFALLLAVVAHPVSGFDADRGAGQQHLYLAQGLVAEGRDADAEAELMAALDADFSPWPNVERWHAEIHLRLGRIALRAGERGRAASKFERGLELVETLPEGPAAARLRRELRSGLVSAAPRGPTNGSGQVRSGGETHSNPL